MNASFVQRVAVVGPPLGDLPDVDLACLAPAPVDRQVVRDPVQPGRDRGVAAEALDVLDRSEQRVLDEIVGIGVGAEQRACEAPETGHGVDQIRRGDATRLRCRRCHACSADAIGHRSATRFGQVDTPNTA